MNNLVQADVGGIIAQTVSPSGAFVTDASGHIVPQTDASGNLAMGPMGGRFVPATDSNGLPITNAQGNVLPILNADGSIQTQMPPTAAPNSLQYGGVKPPGINEGKKLDVITGSDVPGDPIVVLPNGTVLVPGVNLTQPISDFLPKSAPAPVGGVYVFNPE